MLSRAARRRKRKKTIRLRVVGTSERPRLSVKRSLNHIYVQAIDDAAGTTLCSFSTLHKDFQSVKPKAGKSAAAEKLGEVFAEQLKKKGIQKIAFDRGGVKYHGRIKALAESLRQGGIQF